MIADKLRSFVGRLQFQFDERFPRVFYSTTGTRLTYFGCRVRHGLSPLESWDNLCRAGVGDSILSDTLLLLLWLCRHLP